MTKTSIGVLAVSIALAACGGDAPTSPAGNDIALIAWGRSAPAAQADIDRLQYGRLLDNSVLLRNMLSALAGDASGRARIFYTGCDYRSDPCASRVMDPQPFLEALAAVGTTDFGFLFSAEEAATYDVIVADFCLSSWRNPGAIAPYRTYFENGGKLLVLADAFCRLGSGNPPGSLALSTGTIQTSFLMTPRRT